MKGKYMQFSKIALPLVVSVVLAACGGGGGGDTDPAPAPTQQGYFIDSGVEGLSYSSLPSGLSGITSKDGRFEFKEGDTVTFSLGNVELGDVESSEIQNNVVTPLTLAGLDGIADINDPENGVLAQNITRLLMTLDANHMPEDGIDLSAVRSVIEGLTGEGLEIDFSTDDLAAALQALLEAVDLTTDDLVIAQDAIAHLTSSLVDTDGDDEIDGIDTDDDNDGIADTEDSQPLDSSNGTKWDQMNWNDGQWN